MNGFWRSWSVLGGIVLMMIGDSAAAAADLADNAEKVVVLMGEYAPSFRLWWQGLPWSTPAPCWSSR